MNLAIIMGNLGKDPILKDVGDSKVCSFSVATSRKWKTKAGEMKEETQWHNISVWGKQGESCAKYLSKGNQVLVEGRISYTKKGEGDSARFYTQITARDVQFLGSREKKKEEIELPDYSMDIPF